ncbi:hypothetical protein IE53DRAFT_302303, partial [Violaceomyces palustris]
LPPFDQKVRYLPSNLWNAFLPLPFLFVQVHLLLRYPPSRTLAYRWSIVPLVTLLSIRAGFAFHFDFEGEGQGSGRAQHLNFGLGVYAIYAISKSLEWGSSTVRPHLKVSGGRRRRRRSHDQVERSAPDQNPTLPTFYPGTWTPLELDMMLNMRGIGWEWGLPSSPPCQPVRTLSREQRNAWTVRRIRSFCLVYLLCDLLDSAVKNVDLNPAAGFERGGSVWLARQGVLGPLGPPCLVISLGFMVYAAIQAGNCLLGFLSVSILRDSPDRWEPLPFDRPWSATSLRELWTFRWHQIFRRCFLRLAHDPVRNLLSRKIGRSGARFAAVAAVFIYSALLHDWGQAAMVEGQGMWPTKTGAFFVLQGAGTLAEHGFQAWSGRRVGGILGWIWVYTWMTWTGLL